MKKKVLAITLASVILVAFAIWLIINQLENQARTEIVDVKIADYKWTSWWGPGPVGIMWCRGFNITLNNTGTQDLEGIRVDVRFFVNSTEKYVETWTGASALAEYPNMTYGIEADETCDIMGTVITSLSEWADPQVVEMSFIAQVTVNGTVLDDLLLPYTMYA